MAQPQPKSTKGFVPKDSEGHTPGELLKELGSSTKDLIQSEINLARAEAKESASYLGKHSAQAAIFGALLSISVLPFLAFVVIILGRAFGDNYWLSSLIVAVVCAAVGGTMTNRSYQKIKERDLTLPRTRETLQESGATVREETRETRERIQRRAS